MLRQGPMESCCVVNIKSHWLVRGGDDTRVPRLLEDLLKKKSPRPPYAGLVNCAAEPASACHLCVLTEGCFKGFVQEGRNGSREQKTGKTLISVVKVTHSSLCKVTRWHLFEGKVARGAESDLPVFFSHCLTGREVMVSPQLLSPWGRLANSDNSSMYLREFGIRKMILVANLEI